MEAKAFKSNYLLRMLKGDYHPFTPNLLVLDDQHLEYRRRNWYLISTDSENLHFKNVVGVSVDKHIFGASITIKSSGNDPIIVHGFWKKQANEIKRLCSVFIAQGGQKTKLNGEPNTSSNNSSDPSPNKKEVNQTIAQEIRELKVLLDEGVISAEEFEIGKERILKF